MVILSNVKRLGRVFSRINGRGVKPIFFYRITILSTFDPLQPILKVVAVGFCTKAVFLTILFSRTLGEVRKEETALAE